MLSIAACLAVLLQASPVFGQQVSSDTDFRPEITLPAYPAGEGPTVLIDQAHFNYHTADGRYSAFAELLRRDGYLVQGSDQPFSAETLAEGRVLVIANALAEQNAQSWDLPNPSAFSAAEITAVSQWIRDGGSLLLIADHMPMPGAAADLAAAFGILFNNGYAVRSADGEPITSRQNASVAVFGEAAMFTAQVSGPQRLPMGMNRPEADQNAQFLLNLMHWLTGLLPDA